MKLRRPLYRLAGIAIACAILGATFPGVAGATPSTQIWIPSTDIQPYKTFHLNLDTYIRTGKNDDGTFSAPVYVIGPTAGVLSYKNIQAEAGFDLIYNGSSADGYPLYFHAKVGTPEGSLFKESPAIAVGGYNFGTKSNVTNQDIVYGLAAKTFPVLGRISAGYFFGNDKILVDANGSKDADGVLLSWDRTLSEISDKLWAAIDYQGTDSALGALSFGVSYAFAKNVSVILGYDIYNKKATGGENTFTVQVDINF
jgi:hypothetical protein